MSPGYPNPTKPAQDPGWCPQGHRLAEFRCPWSAEPPRHGIIAKTGSGSDASGNAPGILRAQQGQMKQRGTIVPLGNPRARARSPRLQAQRIGLISLLAALVCHNAWAQPVTETLGGPAAPPAPLPETLKEKRRMAQDDIDDKKEGAYFTGLPLVLFDTNKGFGFGGRALWHDNGKRDSPYFEYTPYRHGLYLQALATTGGWQMHKLDYDGLYLAGSPFRLRATAFYERNTEATYFGMGSAALGDLTWSGSGHRYSNLNDLERDLRAVQANGQVASAYHRYDLERPGANLSLERDFFGGRVRALIGVTARYVQVATYDNQTVKGDNLLSGQKNVNATQGPTLLSEHCSTDRITGCKGGWDNLIKLALTFDTRDFEPDPNGGIFLGLTGEVSSQAFGSAQAYARVSATVRGFWSPIPETTDLVLAGRFTYQLQSARTPFHSMPTLAFPDVNEEGLGGLRSLRGYQQNRFVGPALHFANAELRWMPVKFRAAGQHFGVGLVPFLDLGRVYDRFEFSFEHWRLGWGGGLRVAWNQATIAVADFGVSPEGQSFGLTFGNHF